MKMKTKLCPLARETRPRLAINGANGQNLTRIKSGRDRGGRRGKYVWIGGGFGLMLADLGTLFSTETFMARGHSYLWSPRLVILELATNLVIALAAVAIAIALWRAATRVGTRPARAAHRLLALFALGLAAVHGLDAWVIWTPLYGVDVVVRGATAVAAIAAAVILPRMLRRS